MLVRDGCDDVVHLLGDDARDEEDHDGNGDLWNERKHRVQRVRNCADAKRPDGELPDEQHQADVEDLYEEVRSRGDSCAFQGLAETGLGDELINPCCSEHLAEDFPYCLRDQRANDENCQETDELRDESGKRGPGVFKTAVPIDSEQEHVVNPQSVWWGVETWSGSPSPTKSIRTKSETLYRFCLIVSFRSSKSTHAQRSLRSPERGSYCRADLRSYTWPGWMVIFGRLPVGSKRPALDEAVILDSVHMLLLKMDPGRISMTDIALHAKVSRATLYRRWPNLQKLLFAVFHREAYQIGEGALLTFQQLLSTTCTRTALVSGIMEIVSRVRNHAYLLNVLRADPTAVVNGTMILPASSVTTYVTMARFALQLAPDDKSIKRDQPKLPETLVLLAMSMLLHGEILFESTQQQDAKLAFLLDRLLAP